MGKRIPKGWVQDAINRVFSFQVYNYAGVSKPVYDENGQLYNQGEAIVPLNYAYMTFEENGAGTYTASVDLPKNAMLVDIIVHARALWAAATSATMIVGDADDDDGYFTGVDLKATDLLAGESINFTHPGGKKGADLDEPGADKHVRRRLLAAARKITASVTSVGAGTTGRTDVIVVYALPVNVAKAIKTS